MLIIQYVYIGKRLTSLSLSLSLRVAIIIDIHSRGYCRMSVYVKSRERVRMELRVDVHM